MEAIHSRPSVVLVACSGIGKVHGLISREAVYEVTDQRLPGQSEPLCLALLVTGDAEARAKVVQHPCVTVDGCPKLCARKNVELSDGQVAHAVRVYDTLKRHRGAQFGSPTVLSRDGWTAVGEIATEICEATQRIMAGGHEELQS